MSSTIIYNHLIVKVDEDKFLPFFNWGSSNSTMISPDSGREVRSRSWECPRFLLDGGLFMNPDTLQRFFDRWRREIEGRRLADEPDVESNFPYYSCINYPSRKIRTFSQMLTLLQNACKKAPTLDELYCKHSFYIVVSGPADLKKVIVRSQDEWVAAAGLGAMTGGQVSYEPGIRIGQVIESQREANLVKRFESRNNQKKTVVELPTWYALRSREGDYLVRQTHSGYRYMRHSDSYRVKAFPFKQEAEKYLVRVNRVKADRWQVVEITHSPRVFNLTERQMNRLNPKQRQHETSLSLF